jgi:N-acetylneuraminic acid mutarotase
MTKSVSMIIRQSLPALLAVLLFAGCQKDEPVPRDYPTLQMEISDVSNDGATFEAGITGRGDHIIIEYGFVWGLTRNPDIWSSERVIHKNNLRGTAFSDRISTTLEEGRQYYVYPYLKTEVYTVYGPEKSFTSLGSSTPVITHFEPLAARWGDTLKITGKHFSYRIQNNSVKLGESEAKVIACTDTTLTVLVPAVMIAESVRLSLAVSGYTTFAQDSFTFLVSAITSAEPLLLGFGDTLIIRGIYLDMTPGLLKVMIDDQEASIIALASDSVMTRIPPGLRKRLNPLKVMVADHVLPFSSMLEIRGPVIDSLSMDTIRSLNESITVYGHNFSNIAGNNTVLVNGTKATVTEANWDSVRITMPPSLVPDIYYSVSKELDLSVTATEQTTQYPDNLWLLYKGRWTRKKDFPGTPRYDAAAFSINGKGYIATGKTPGDPSGLNDLWEYDPEKDEWIRKSDFPGASRGAATSFMTGNYGYVGLGLGTEYYSDFHRYDPVTDTWSPIAGFPGIAREKAASFVVDATAFVGTGKNAESYYMTDIWKYNPANNQWTAGPAFPEVGFPHNVADLEGFTLDGKGFMFVYNLIYRLDGSGWTDMQAPLDITAWDNLAFTFMGRAYIGMGCPHASGGTGYIWEWEPAANKVTRLNNYYENRRQSGSVFVIGDRIFIIGGITMNSTGDADVTLNDVWEYNPNVPVRF